jgi:5-methylthioadenosine/S-adenosylhomocysteine deaminase
MAAIQLIHDTTIVTADDAGSILYDAALAVRDGRIAALGPSVQLRAQFPDAERIDGRGRALFPGFANTHTHLSRVLARGIYEDLSPSHTPPFTGGLAPLPLPALSPDEERVMVLLGALEAIRSGTTLVLEESAGTRQLCGGARRYGAEAGPL